MKEEQYTCTNPKVMDGTMLCDGFCSLCGYHQPMVNFEAIIESEKQELEDEKVQKSKPYIERLKAKQDNDDIEYGHIAADNILCELLTELGYGDVVKEYNKIEKWYA